ncbi:MAG: pantothenate kinase [Candidatus Omnitrophota bacterium]|nr:MAG: pantothenate kinase [Candidatus Omnitrophota bacterium]
MKRLLAIDIGNTNIDIGLLQEGKVVKRWIFPSAEYHRDRLSEIEEEIEAIVICSVVPSLEKRIEKDLTQRFAIKPVLSGRDIRVEIPNLYKNPKQVGQDRLIGAYSASILYGFPVIIVDFGTALTFDLVSENREYLGGVIVPGVSLCWNALCKKAELLPQIEISSVPLPRECLGKSSEESMVAGIVYGFGSLCEGIIRRMKEKCRRKAVVIGTGGDISLISPYCSQIEKVDRDLILKGLWFLYYRYGK